MIIQYICLAQAIHNEGIKRIGRYNPVKLCHLKPKIVVESGKKLAKLRYNG